MKLSNVIFRKRDDLRNEIKEAFDTGKITKTEMDLIWDLTTNRNYKLARIYLDQAINTEP